MDNEDWSMDTVDDYLANINRTYKNQFELIVLTFQHKQKPIFNYIHFAKLYISFCIYIVVYIVFNFTKN